MSKKSSIVYFDKPGKENTEELIEIVSKYQKENKVQNIVISSNTGKSAVLLNDSLNNDANLVAVTLHSGFHEGDDISWDPKLKDLLEKEGVTCYMGSHALSGIGRGISRKLGGVTPAEVVAQTYKTISSGFKVAIEVSIMAADAGLVPTDSEIIAIGGKGGGVDTAIVLHASHMNNFFDLSVNEILAMPRL